MRFLVLALALVAPMAAFADTAEDVVKLTAALEAAGCVFTVDNGAAIAEAAGLDETRLLTAVNDLFAKGLVVATDDGSMKLQSEACQ